METNLPASLLYNALLRTEVLEHGRLRKLWGRLWKFGERKFSTTPVNTVIHGREVVVNFGYAYPLVSRRVRTFNAPLVELTAQMFRCLNRPLVFVDVGAAVGDTALLVFSNCPDMVSDCYCIDGDKEFFSYLCNNLATLNRAHPILSMLSDSETTASELVRIHAGTASAQGEGKVEARPLDSIRADTIGKKIDILKIDVDGFDGLVLAGSQNILSEDRPAVIFEWHPIHCADTGNDCLRHFQVLSSNRYERFLWFTKYGEFSHFSYSFSQAEISDLASLCIRGKHHYDWHYDVVALPNELPLNPLELAEMAFARQRPSRF